MKPYGYVWTSLKDGMETRFTNMYPNEFYKPFDIVPLYTHPAELTDEEIEELAMEYLENTGKGIVGVYDFVRAILRKAQEK